MQKLLKNLTSIILSKIKIIAAILLFCCAINAWSSTGSDINEEQAFKLTAEIILPSELHLHWEIAPGTYLYQKQISVLNSQNKSLLTGVNLPAGLEKNDEVLGKYIVYRDELTLVVPWDDKSDYRMLVQYQGCSADGFCFLPTTKLLEVNAHGVVSISNSDFQEFPISTEEEVKEVDADQKNLSLSERFADSIKKQSLPLTLLIFFGLGLILSFTPCVLPMIPLVVNLIVGPKNMSPYKSFILASSYVSGMAISYTIAGVVVGMLGASMSGWLQQPAVLITTSILLVFLACNQFGVMQIKLPHFNTHLHRIGQKQTQGSLLGAFVVGIISALIISPCVTAPLIGVLTYIGQNGNPITGGLTLLSLSLGMGLPLIAVAMLSSMVLPKAGQWMTLTKDLMGLALLALAIWIASRVVPNEITLMLWGVLCIISAIFFKAFHKLKRQNVTNIILKVIGMIVALYGVFLVINGIEKVSTHYYSNRNQPQANYSPWKQINNLSELNLELNNINHELNGVIIDFTATWCVNCKKLEEEVFADSTVQNQLKKFKLLQVDLSNMNQELEQIMHHLQVYGPPTILFYNQSGQEVADQRIAGVISKTDFIEVLATLSN